MKTSKYYFAAVCLIALMSLTFSCDDGDTTKPVINLIEPEEGAELQIGSVHGVHLEMDLSDDEMLASYKVDIHNSDDGHVHSKAEETPNVSFAFSKSWDVSGKKNAHIHHHEITIPANAKPGKYHLMVYCTDASGNEAYVARNIVLSYEGDTGEHE